MPRVLALRALALLTAILALPCASALAAPPPNDDFANAEVIGGAPASATGSTAEATLQPGEPNHASDSSGRSIWFRWVAPESGTAVFDTAGSGYPTTLAAYTGDSVGALTRLASLDADSSLGERSRIRFTAVQGTAYNIAVDVDYGVAGAVKLNVALGPAPPGDSQAAPEPLSGNDALATSDTTYATLGPGEATSGGGAVWYAWTATASGEVEIDTAGSGFDTTVGVYPGSSLSWVAWNNDPVTGVKPARVVFRAVAGTTYRIVVDGARAADFGALRLALRQAGPPANDAYSDATTLPSEAAATAAGDSLGATAETGEPRHYGYSAPRGSVWYAWTAPKSGSLTIRADAAGFVPVLAAYAGDTLAGAARVANQAQSWTGGPQQIRVRVEAGVTYRIAVDRLTVGGRFALSLTLADSPPNDDFAHALPLAGLAADVVGDTSNATQEPCEPVHDDNYYDPSVWYSWTAPATGGVTIDTAGSDYPTVLGIYTGDALCTLARVPVGRLTGAGVPAKRTFRAIAGVTYRIAVDGQHGRTGAFKLSLRHAPPPANDLLAAAETLAGPVASTTGTLLGATAEAGEPSPGGAAGATVWYAWTAPTSGPTALRLGTTSFNFGVSVYTGDAIDSLSLLSSGSSSASPSFRATAGRRYLIAIDGGSRPDHGDFKLDLKHDPSPANDDFLAAAPLAGSLETRSGTTAGATAETDDPLRYGSVWYSWTAPADGAVSIDTAGSAFNTVLGVYTGSALGALTSAAYNDNASYGVTTSRVTLRVTAGTTYRIGVGGYWPDSRGEFKLRLSFSGPPANDAFASATSLPPAAAVSIPGTTLAAAAEAGEPAHYSYESARASVWYAWTAPSGGALTIKATSEFQPVLAAYTGATVTGLTRVRNQAQDWDGGPEQIRIRVEAGRTYYIAVDARYSLGGDFQLSLQLVPSPANDDFENPREIVGLAADLVGSTLGATQQDCEPVHDSNYYDPSVWFTWTAPASGAVTLDTGGSEFPTVLAVYVGEDLCRLQREPLRQMSLAGQPAKRGFRAVEGRTYRIALDGVRAKMGSYRLSLRHSPPPPNDMFADAEQLEGPLATVDGTNFGATAETGEPGGTSGATVWYSWTAPATGLARAQLTKSDFGGHVAAYSGDTPAALVREGGDSYYYSGAQHFRVVAGRTYRIAVDGGWASAQGDFTLEVRSLAAPPNDDFAAAEELSGETGAVDGTTSGATTETGEPYLDYGPRGSVWYSWTAPKSGLTVLDFAVGSASVEVFRGDSLQSLERVPGERTFRATEGQTYRIAVHRPATLENAAFRLTWKMIAPPPNDAFEAAIPISGASLTQSGTTVAATREAGEPASTAYWYDERRATVWYSWKAPSDGLARLYAGGAGVAAYSGDSLASLELLTPGYSYDGAYFRARAGTTYRIKVEGSELSTYGSFSLNLTLADHPANDDFEDAEELGDTATGTTTGATAEKGEKPFDSGRRGTVWYTWKPTASGTGVVSASSYNQAVGVYTGDSVDALTLRAGASYGGEVRLSVKAGATYRIAVSSELTTYARPFKLTAEVQPGPPNDDFADATELSGAPASADGSNVNATFENGEPYSYGGHSVWYRWTAPSSGEVTVDLSGSSFDTTLSAHTGSAVGALTTLGTDRDSGDGSTSKLTVSVRAGTTYSFRVDDDYAGPGSIKLALKLTPAPANDDFAAAEPISGQPLVVLGSNVASTREPGEPSNTYAASGKSIWYAWTAAENGRVALDLTGSEFVSAVGVYEGSALGALTRIASGYNGDTANRVEFPARRGQTYRISVDGAYGAAGALRMSLTQAEAPPNDDLERAHELDGRAAVAAGTTFAATTEPSEPSSYYYGTASVWYRWKAPASGTVTVTGQELTFSPSMTAYAGATYAGMRSVATGSRSLRFYAHAGASYSVRVAGGYSSGTGRFKLELKLAEPPTNDLFANAAELAGPAVDVSGSTVFATQESCEPIHDDNYYDPSVWFSWKAPSDGTVTLDTAGSSFATVLGIYTGDALCSLSRVTVNRLSGAGVPAKRSFRASAGVTYRIAVDGTGGATGDYRLSLRHAADQPLDSQRLAQAPPPEPPSDQGSGEEQVEPPPLEQQDEPPLSAGSGGDPQPGDLLPDELQGQAPQDPQGGGSAPGDPQIQSPGPSEPQIQTPAPGEAQTQDPQGGNPAPGGPAPGDSQTETPAPGDSQTETPDPGDSQTEAPPSGDLPSGGEPAADPPPAGSPPGGPPPAAWTAPAPPPSQASSPLRLSASFPRQRIASVLAGGLTGSAACARTCVIAVVVSVDPQAARKAKLGMSKLTTGRATVTSTDGAPGRFAVRLPKAALKRLRAMKALPLTVKLVATSESARDERTLRLTLKR
ncbi:MAG TPA: proline-rich domain-containing protein [Thermoleophilaceae bacterium]